jgi:hypothetical protein
MLNSFRRRFLRQAAALSGLPILAKNTPAAVSTRQAKLDAGMLIWFGHSDLASIAEIMARCADYGFTTVYLQPRYVGKAIYRSKVVAPFDNMYATKTGKGLNETLSRFDPYDVCVREATRRGLKVVAQISIFDLWFPGLEDRFYERHPQYLMLHKNQGLCYQGVPCYAEKGAQDYCIAEAKELVERGAEGIIFDMGSHQLGWWPPGYGNPEADSFGFNPPLVEEFRRRYGVDVLQADFDKKQWYALHGEFFTQFLRKVKTAIREKPLIVGVPPEGYLAYGGRSQWTGSLGRFAQAAALRIDLEWQKWLQDGIVDALGLYVSGLNGPHGAYFKLLAEAMKQQCGQRKCYLHVMYTSDTGELKELLSQVRSSALDGFIYHEQSVCQGNPGIWKVFG